MKKLLLLILVFIVSCYTSSDNFVNSVGEIKVGATFQVEGEVFYCIGDSELYLLFKKSEHFPSTKIEQGTRLKVLQIRRVRTSVEAIHSVSRYYIKVQILDGKFKGNEAEAVYIFIENGEYKNVNSRISIIK